jgi:hypothetical protein
MPVVGLKKLLNFATIACFYELNNNNDSNPHLFYQQGFCLLCNFFICAAGNYRSA